MGVVSYHLSHTRGRATLTRFSVDTSMRPKTHAHVQERAHEIQTPTHTYVPTNM